MKYGLLAGIVLGMPMGGWAQSELLNPSFETGDLAGWEKAGSQVMVVTETSPFLTPAFGAPIGQNMVQIGNIVFGGEVTARELDHFFHMPSGSLGRFVSRHGNPEATSGFGLWQDLKLKRPAFVRVKWAYGGDYPPYFDNGFLVANGEYQSLGRAGRLGEVSPFQTTDVALEAGKNTLGFGTVNVIDDDLTSELYVDLLVIPSEDFFPMIEAQHEIAYNLSKAVVQNMGDRLGRLRERAGDAMVAAMEDTGSLYALNAPSGPPMGGMLFADLSEGQAPAVSDMPCCIAGVSSPDIRHWKVFASGNFDFTTQDPSAEGLAGFHSDTQVGTAGAEYRITRAWAAGLAASYVTSNADLGRIGDIDSDGAAFSAYTNMNWGGFYADALYSFGLFEYDQSRTMPGFGTAQSTPDVFTHTGEANLGYNITSGRLVTGPTGQLRVIHASIEGYDEKGPAGSPLLSNLSQDTTSLVSTVGWQIAYQLKPVGGVAIVPSLGAGWSHEYLDGSEDVVTSLVGSPQAAMVNSIGGPDRDYFSLDAGLRLACSEALGFTLNYHGELAGGERESNLVGATVDFSF
jgi:outer membrane autotransporter protein